MTQAEIAELNGTKNAVYLLHFDRKLCHAGHYLGSAADLGTRLGQHAAGNGARLTGVIKELGIGWALAKTWTYPTLKEARLAEHHWKQHYKNSSRLCPICKATA